VNRCLRFLARAIRPHDRAHDRRRCLLYVRAQLDTAGLSWTQRDLRQVLVIRVGKLLLEPTAPFRIVPHAAHRDALYLPCIAARLRAVPPATRASSRGPHPQPGYQRANQTS
jgi:hypothetical protein